MKSKSRILHLKNQLQNFKKNDLTVDDYMANLTTMAEDLKEAVVSIDDGELSLFTLNGLDSSYDSFFIIETLKVEDTSLASLLGLLRV